jgi:DHA1 family multidrug resistance protein-like MFS transporter
MPARAVLSASLVGAAIALLLFAFSHSIALLILTMAGVGLGIGTAATSAYAAAGSVIPRHAHGTSFGFLTSAQLTGMSLGPVVGGLVAARSIRVVFVAGAAALLLLAFLIRNVMVDRDLPVPSPPPVEEA